MNVYWSKLDVNDVNYIVAATEQGLCYIDVNDDVEELERWCSKHIEQAELIKSDAELQSYIEQLLQYWNGERSSFDCPLDLRGTTFQQRVWDALKAIPYGKTVSYLDIAVSVGNRAAVRAVGGAIGKNPVMIVVPCHRVIGSNGKLTGFSAGGLGMKEKLLSHEQACSDAAH